MKKSKKNYNNNNKPKVWRSFNELEASEEFLEDKHREFPKGASELPEGFSRRDFFKTMGAGMAVAGVAGLSSCSIIRQPEQHIYPYANMPESLVPGKSTYYATAMSLGEDVIGLLAESYGGRPTKLEGNPLHPSSNGKTNHLHQASVLDLYDPDRENSDFAAKLPADAAIAGIKNKLLSSDGGSGVGIAYSAAPSPTFHRLLGELKAAYPGLSTYRISALNNDNACKGIESVSGKVALPTPNYQNSDVVVSLGADILSKEDGNVRSAAEVAARRDVEAGNLNRMYVYEESFTLTGSNADHRFLVRRSGMHLLVYALISELYSQGIRLIDRNFIEIIEGLRGEISSYLAGSTAQASLVHVARDLLASPGRSVVVAGRDLSPEVHAAVFYINSLLRSPVAYHQLPFAESELGANGKYETSLDALGRLSGDLAGGKVSDLLVLETNLLGIAPADYSNELLAGLQKANSVVLTHLPNATSKVAKTVIRAAHFLEQWGDLATRSGDLTVAQPVLLPLYEGTYSAIGLLAQLGVSVPFGTDEVTEKDLLVMGNAVAGRAQNHAIERGAVRATHQVSYAAFQQQLRNGVQLGWRNTAAGLDTDVFGNFVASLQKNRPAAAAAGLELVFTQDYSVYDGTYANNAWLQELPDPITKLTWDNAVVVSKATADRLSLKNYSRVRLTSAGNSVEGAVWVLPGQADDVINVAVGYNELDGKISTGAGFSVAPLRTSKAYHLATDVAIEPLGGEPYNLASVQDHWAVEDELFDGQPSSNSQNGRPLYRKATADAYKKNPGLIKEMVEVPQLQAHHDKLKAREAQGAGAPKDAEGMSVFNEQIFTGEYQWGMTIDLARCNGCNACVVACQSENNIPVVGKDQVLKGREMHWIRLDRYFEGDPYDPEVVHQPVNCMQCEQAPCEQVCPVAATVHSQEGLNDMVYNRCIGTRYCANNCPYKVRRFNYFDYHGEGVHGKRRISTHIFDLFKEPADSLQQRMNPDVTVRMRGVMEKCTYCVQRINQVRGVAENGKRHIHDGEITTACQQACPASAIEFGDVGVATTAVSKKKLVGREYALLAELNIQPRTTYLAAITNPNPALQRVLAKS